MGQRGNARAEHMCRRAAFCVVRGGASKQKLFRTVSDYFLGNRPKPFQTVSFYLLAISFWQKHQLFVIVSFSIEKIYVSMVNKQIDLKSFPLLYVLSGVQPVYTRIYPCKSVYSPYPTGDSHGHLLCTCGLPPSAGIFHDIPLRHDRIDHLVPLYNG